MKLTTEEYRKKLALWDAAADHFSHELADVIARLNTTASTIWPTRELVLVATSGKAHATQPFFVSTSIELQLEEEAPILRSHREQLNYGPKTPPQRN